MRRADKLVCSMLGEDGCWGVGLASCWKMHGWQVHVLHARRLHGLGVRGAMTSTGGRPTMLSRVGAEDSAGPGTGATCVYQAWLCGLGLWLCWVHWFQSRLGLFGRRPDGPRCAWAMGPKFGLKVGPKTKMD